MKGLKRDVTGAYDVDLRAFTDQSFFARMRGEPFAVDPFLVSRVLCAAMAEGTVRDAEGGRVMPNYFRLLLHPERFEELMRLRVTLHQQLGGVLAKHAAAASARLVDRPAAQFAPDESDTVPRDRAHLAAPEIRETGALPSDRPGEVTLRFGDEAPPPSAVVAPSAEATSDRPVAAWLVWSLGSAPLREGQRYAFGRGHEGAPPRFIELTGAPVEVNRVHAWVEVRGEDVRVGRAGSNPVRVQGKSLQPHGEITVQATRVEIVLSEAVQVAVERRT